MLHFVSMQFFYSDEVLGESERETVKANAREILIHNREKITIIGILAYRMSLQKKNIILLLCIWTM